MTGGLGADEYRYQFTAADSTSTAFDTIVGFDALSDHFFLFTGGIVVNAEIVGGTLRQTHFDSDLGTAMAGLAAGHAVLFSPNIGSFAGDTILVVNTDGVAGYQAGTDMVIEMKNMLNKASLDATDFHS